MLDTYTTRVVLTVIAVALVAIVVRPIASVEAGLAGPKFKAGEPLPGMKRSIPRKWERFGAATGIDRDLVLWFEDARPVSAVDVMHRVRHSCLTWLLPRAFASFAISFLK